ncbi:HAD-IIA family hydrolase [uncultured Agrobacterium sp.]|nr:HAD family hydrolase [uncultured Agrobacterium sp.]
MHEFHDADGVLFDLDGTLVSGGKVLPWAHGLIEQSRGRFAIVTNDAEHTAVQIAALLQSLGIPVSQDRIVAAGMEALRQVSVDMPGARLLIAASRSLQDYATDLGLEVTDVEPDVVLIGRDRAFSYDKIRTLSNAVLAGAQLVVCNPDKTHPAADGSVVPETGALAASVLACTGPVPHHVIGKPQPGLFLSGMALIGSTPTRTLMVGDNPETDGKGAAGVGIRFVRVGFEHGEEDWLP